MMVGNLEVAAMGVASGRQFFPFLASPQHISYRGMWLVGVCALFLTWHSALPAQTSGGGSGGNSGGSTGGNTGGGNTGGGSPSPGGNVPGGNLPGSGRPDNNIPTLPGQDRNDPFGRSEDMFSQRPIYLSGKVVVDGSEPAPIETVIERVCNGQVIPEGYVNSKGEFHVQLGRNSQMFNDASNSSWGMTDPSRRGMQNPQMGMGQTVSERDLISCEVRATLPGYRSNSIPLAGRRSLDNPDVGTLVLTRLSKVEGFTISATTLQAPKEAKKNYERGLKELRKSKFDKAQPLLEKALAEYPRYAIAWYALGQTQEGLKQVEQAEASYLKAIDADGKFLSPYLRMASLAADKQEWKKVEEYSALTIRMNPIDFPLAYYLNALGNLQLKEFEKAEESAREAKRMDPGNRMNRLDYLLAVILANQSKYTEAAKLMRSYIGAVPGGSEDQNLKDQLGRMEQMALTQSNVSN